MISGRGFLQGSNFYIHNNGLVRIGNGLKVMVDHYVILKPNSALYAERLEIQNKLGGRIAELQLESADMVVTSDAHVKSNRILLTRAGEYQKAQHYVDPNLLKWVHYNGKASLQGRCILERELVNTLGNPGKIDIGGNFYIDSENRPVNKYSNVNVRGIITNSFEEVSEKLENTYILDSKVHKGRERYKQWILGEGGVLFAAHCDNYNIHILGQRQFYEKHTTKTILAVTKQHSDINVQAKYDALSVEGIVDEKVEETAINIEDLESTAFKVHIATDQEIAERYADKEESRYVTESFSDTSQEILTSKAVINENISPEVRGLDPDPDEFDEEDILPDQDDDLGDNENNNPISDEVFGTEENIPPAEFKENKAKSTDEIWQEFEELNSDLEEYDEIRASFEAMSEISKKKDIDNWSAEDIKHWHIDVSNVQQNIAEVIAIAKRALYLTNHIQLRDAQLISVLSFYHAPDHRIAEIGTGEGKTVIIAILALLKVLEGHNVNIVTSSHVLARSAVKDMLTFYQMFGFSCSHNTDDHTSSGMKEAYNHPIVYGDVVHFIGDKLRHENGRNVLGERQADIVIVDEVDSMLIDQSSHTVLLSEKISRFELLQTMFTAIWAQYKVIVNQLELLENGQYIWHNPIFKGEDVVDYESIIINDPDRVIISHLNSYIEHAILDEEHRVVKVPRHLTSYIRIQKEAWIKAVLIANSYVLEKDYIFVKTEDGDRDVRPFDKISNLVQERTVFADGVQQFLQLKEGLKMTAETLTINFASNVYFFSNYKEGKVYGLSGTIGIDSDQSLLNELYDVDFIKMPSFKVKNFVLYPPMAYHKYVWEEKIVESAIKIARDEKRAVVLVAAHMQQAKIFYQMLREYYEVEHLRLYTDDRTDSHVIDEELEVGRILVSTSAIGRGIDLKVSNELNESGGLHVLLTYLPDNERVDWQVYGRTARSGNPGSGQMILNYEQTLKRLYAIYPDYALYGVESFEDLLEWRNEAESERLEQDKECGIPMLLLKDKLFSEYRKFFAEFNNRGTDEFNEITAELSELWGVWLKDKEHLMSCRVDEGKNVEETEKLLKEELYEFFAKCRREIVAGKFIKNPTYQAHIAFDSADTSGLNKAIKLDPDFAFSSLYLKAVLEIRDNQKHRSLYSLQEALSNLEDVMLPLYSQGQALAVMAGVDPLSPLIKQYHDYIEIYTSYANNIKQSISLIDQLKDTGKANIQQGEFIKFEEMIPTANTMQDELDDVRELGLRGFVEVDYYITPKKSSFLGNFVSVVLSVIQIVAGTALGVASGGFLAHFSSGLIANGLKDILFTAINTVQGIGMELKQVFKSKTIDLAVNAITAGLKVVASKVAKHIKDAGYAEGSWQSNAGKTLEGWTGKDSMTFGERVYKDTLITVTSRALDEVTRIGFDTQKDNIETHVYSKISKMLSRHQEEIERIAANDLWKHDRVAERALVNSGEEILMHHYLPGYKQIHQEILREVGGRIPYIGTVLTAYEVVGAASKVLSLTDQFCEEFEGQLAAKVPDDKKLMHTRLGVMGASSDAILNKMEQQNAFPGGKIDCERELNLGTYVAEKDRVKEACHEVAGLKVSGISAYKEKITAELSQIITRHIMEMVSKGIFHPLNIQAGQALGTSIYEGTHDALFKAKVVMSNLPQPEKEELLAKADNKELTENQKRAIREGYEPVKLGNKLMFFNPATGYYVDIDKLYEKGIEEKAKPSSVKKQAKSKVNPATVAFPTLEKSTYNLGEHIKPGTMTFKEETLVAAAGSWEVAESELAKASQEILERKKELLHSLHHEFS
ncbi:Accessory Sec system translocase SecA2 [Rickettsiales bacterium Ac37b]|nr:Accessory Sec system translocase SecA2 [Rickettsiales bacterium Ac37b]